MLCVIYDNIKMYLKSDEHQLRKKKLKVLIGHARPLDDILKELDGDKG